MLRRRGNLFLNRRSEVRSLSGALTFIELSQAFSLRSCSGFSCGGVSSRSTNPPTHSFPCRRLPRMRAFDALRRQPIGLREPHRRFAPSVSERLGLSGANGLYRWKKDRLRRAGPSARTLGDRVAQLEVELRRVERQAVDFNWVGEAAAGGEIAHGPLHVVAQFVARHAEDGEIIHERSDRGGEIFHSADDVAESSAGIFVPLWRADRVIPWQRARFCPPVNCPPLRRYPVCVTRGYAATELC